MTGFGFEFEIDPKGAIRSYWKEGTNFGASGILRHYPAQGVTLTVLAVGEDAAWRVIDAIDAAAWATE